MQEWASHVPPDHDTVWGFLAKEEPHVLDMMQNPVLGLLPDQERAKQFATLYGYDALPVPAPRRLLDEGIPEVFAFPLGVLREVFPTNP